MARRSKGAVSINPRSAQNMSTRPAAIAKMCIRDSYTITPESQGSCAINRPNLNNSDFRPQSQPKHGT